MHPLPSVYKELPQGKSLFYTWFEALHTRIDIVCCHLSEACANTLSQAIQTELLRIEKKMNRFDPESELYLINSGAAHTGVPVSDELAQVVFDCLKYREQTQGYFDITIQSGKQETGAPPPIRLTQENGKWTIAFSRPGISIDLGGYAKGYALDRCRQLVEAAGCPDALLSFGNSSVLAIGNHPAGHGWKISPSDNPDEETCLHNQCLTTSGNEDGKHHIYSPLTGKLIQDKFTLSVISPTGSEGEVLSTALFAAYGDHLSSLNENQKPLSSQMDAPAVFADILQYFGRDVSVQLHR